MRMSGLAVALLSAALMQAVSGIHVNKIQPKADDSVDKKDDEKVNNKPDVIEESREDMRATVKVHKKEVTKTMAGEKAKQTKMDAMAEAEKKLKEAFKAMADAEKQPPLEGHRFPEGCEQTKQGCEQGKEAGWEVDAYVKAKREHDRKKQKADEKARWAKVHADAKRSRDAVGKYRDKIRAEEKKEYDRQYDAAVEKIKEKEKAAEAKKAEKKAAAAEKAEKAGAPSLAAPGILLTSLLLCASVIS